MKKFNTTVEPTTLFGLATELLNNAHISQDTYSKVCGQIAASATNPIQLSTIHNELLRIKSKKEDTDPTRFTDEDKFWAAVEAEKVKINGLIGIYNKSSGAMSYVVRDLEKAGQRDYIDINTEKDTKAWLKRNGINTDLILKTEEMKSPLIVDTFKHWNESKLAEENTILGFTSVPFAINKEPLPVINRELNTWRSSFAIPEKGDGHLEVLEFLKSQTCNNNEYTFEVLIKWMAHLMQKPSEKNNIAMSAYHARRGIGKGTLASIIERLVGVRNSTLEADPKDLSGFNNLLAGKIFINFDEVAFVGDHHQTAVMKKMVTEGKERQEKKGKDAGRGRSFCRILLTTNTRNGTLASVFERRYFDLPIQTGWKDDGILDSFVERHHLKENEESAKFLTKEGRYDIPWVKNLAHYLLYDVDLKGFNFNEVKSVVEDTETLLNRIHNTYREDAAFAFILEWLASGEDFIEFSSNDDPDTTTKIKFGEQRVRTADFWKAFQERTKGEFIENTTQIKFTKALQAHFGFVKYQGMVNNKQANCFRIPSREELYRLCVTDNAAFRVKWELPPLKNQPGNTSALPEGVIDMSDRTSRANSVRSRIKAAVGEIES